MRWPLGALSIILIAVAAWASPTQPFVDGYFIHFHSQWQHPPPEAHLPIRTADATIVQFKSSGEFVELSCNVIEQADKTWRISVGDGYVVAVGTWQYEENGITVRRNSIDRMVWPIGGEPNELCASKAVFFEPVGEALFLGKSRFTATTKVDPKDVESYAAGARKSRARCGA